MWQINCINRSVWFMLKEVLFAFFAVGLVKKSKNKIFWLP